MTNWLELNQDHYTNFFDEWNTLPIMTLEIYAVDPYAQARSMSRNWKQANEREEMGRSKSDK